jgi:DNA-binding MarR family transcriptional regulator
VTEQSGGAGAPVRPDLCLRLVQMFPRIIRGMRRWQDQAPLAASAAQAPLSRRHAAALGELRDGPLTVGELAERLGLSLPTVSGVLADLDRAGYVEREPDPGDRRRTIARITPDKASLITQWLDGAASPIARVLDQLDTAEQEAFLKAMSLLETELRGHDTGR